MEGSQRVHGAEGGEHGAPGAEDDEPGAEATFRVGVFILGTGPGEGRGGCALRGGQSRIDLLDVATFRAGRCVVGFLDIAVGAGFEGGWRSPWL